VKTTVLISILDENERSYNDRPQEAAQGYSRLPQTALTIMVDSVES
jgi:hypothetical protein